MIIYQEVISSDFEGTIIDIESIGNFNNSHPDNDSRQYNNIIPTIFGYINSTGVTIYCAEGEENIDVLKDHIKKEAIKMSGPLYAFNARFERGVLHHACNLEPLFKGEINVQPREKKKYAVQNMGIDNYDDPFNDEGRLCISSWQNGEYDKCIKHNRSCLLKERDILIQRGSRELDEFFLN